MADEEMKLDAENEEVEGEANESVEAPGIVAGITAGLIDREMTSAGLAVHKFFQIISSIEDHNLFYYRFDPQLDLNRDTELDNSTSEFFDYLDEVVNAKYQQDAEEIGSFIGRLADDYE